MQEDRTGDGERTDWVEPISGNDAFQTAAQADGREVLRTGEEPEQPAALQHFSGSVTFAEAEAYGTSGMILWAIVNGGRSPSLENIRAAIEKQSGKLVLGGDLRRSIRDLIRQGILEEVIAGRFRFVVNSAVATFAVRCSFCPTKGKPGRGKDEAIANATAEGFVVEAGKAFCPVHAAGRFLVPGGPSLNETYAATGGGGSSQEPDRREGRVSKGAAKRAEKAQKRLQGAGRDKLTEPLETGAEEPYRTEVL